MPYKDQTKIKCHHGLAKKKKSAGGTSYNRITRAGFNIVWTATKGFAPNVEVRQDDYIKGICSPRSKGLNHGKRS